MSPKAAALLNDQPKRRPKNNPKTHSKTTSKAKSTVERKPAVDLQSLKIAIVCDWLTGTGGAERVVLELHKMFPKAPIYTSQYDKNPRIWYGDTWFKDADVRTTWLQRLPKRVKKFLPVLRAYSFSRLDLSDYDLVIISSGAEAKAVKTGPHTTSILYCHAPTHYYWSLYDDYLKHPGFGALNGLARLGLLALVRPLRRWDYTAAQKPTHVIANSTHTKDEIKKYYGRNATVVYPPVDTGRFAAPTPASVSHRPAEHFGFVVAGRQTPYKRIDLAVAACSSLNLPLTVIGNGPEHTRLTAMSGPTVRFLNGVSDDEMGHHFKLAKAFIFPGIDDFGIVAVEALSAGTPVIAYKAGGALDYVHQGVTGSFFEKQTVESLVETLRSFEATDFNSAIVTAEADKYSVANFVKNMTTTIQSYLQ